MLLSKAVEVEFSNVCKGVFTNVLRMEDEIGAVPVYIEDQIEDLRLQVVQSANNLRWNKLFK